jgi:prolyl-tRNA editing enzyme YbaK/EbsC (Cys-tRNA(Pro) deacylase)
MSRSPNLSRSAQRVQDAIEAQGFSFDVAELPDSTRTAQDAAEAIGCTVGQIAKSLVFRGTETDRPLLAIASGPNRVDEAALSALAGESIEQASPGFVRERTGFAIGGVPPLGHAEALSTWIDEDLLQYDAIWAAAGTPNAVFKLDPSTLADLTDGTIAPLKQ